MSAFWFAKAIRIRSAASSDCKMKKLIVLDEMIGSMTEFKQIIGRGTRLREKEGRPILL